MSRTPQQQREYYQKNKARIDKKNREYAIKHRADIVEYHRRWYLENRDEQILKTTEWHNKNPEKVKQIKAKYRNTHRKNINRDDGFRNYFLKIEVFSYYSKNSISCNCCGFHHPNIRFLTIDHIDNRGHSHRRSGRRLLGVQTYRYLVNNNYPTGYQVLCWNCNSAKGTNKGFCPHKKIVKTPISQRYRGYEKDHQNKDIVLARYSKGQMRCMCCSFKHKSNLFLTIDHRNNKGANHITPKGIRLKGDKLYRWLIKNKFPKGYQTLCWNCNSTKSINAGICPHKWD